jgi:hypothetical protein
MKIKPVRRELNSPTKILVMLFSNFASESLATRRVKHVIISQPYNKVINSHQSPNLKTFKDPKNQFQGINSASL